MRNYKPAGIGYWSPALNESHSPQRETIAPEAPTTLTLPAPKLQQFTQELFLLSLAAADFDRVVRFEALGEAGV